MRRTSAAIAIIVLLASACSSGIGKPGHERRGQFFRPRPRNPARPLPRCRSAAPATIPVASDPPAEASRWGRPHVPRGRREGKRRTPGRCRRHRGEFMTIPEGIPVAWWTRLLPRAGQRQDRARLVQVRGIDNPPSLTIEGTWRLPTIGDDPPPAGLSGDASTQVAGRRPAGEAHGIHVPVRRGARVAQGKAQVITLTGASTTTRSPRTGASSTSSSTCGAARRALPGAPGGRAGRTLDPEPWSTSRASPGHGRLATWPGAARGRARAHDLSRRRASLHPRARYRRVIRRVHRPSCDRSR